MSTESYYREHYQEFIDDTFSCDMHAAYEMFERYLPDHAHILDVGFGSARDMLHFASEGYDVKGFDLEPCFVERAKEMDLNAMVSDILSFDTHERFDGIWACASFLHLRRDVIAKQLERYKGFLKSGGVFFVSLKEGDFEEKDDLQRHMSYFSEKELKALGFDEIRRGEDQRGRPVVWLYAIYRRPM